MIFSEIDIIRAILIKHEIEKDIQDYLISLLHSSEDDGPELMEIFKQHLSEHIPQGPDHDSQLDALIQNISTLAGFNVSEVKLNENGPTILDRPMTMDKEVVKENKERKYDLGNSNSREVKIEGVDPYLLLNDPFKLKNVIECSVEEFVEATKNDDPKSRLLALRELCPCHVKKNIPEFWNRIIDMIHDPDPDVRYQVLHNLCDGSPNEREDDVINAIKELEHDESKIVKRAVNRVLSSYNRTGKWNVL
jgi:hypothetical protein